MDIKKSALYVALIILGVLLLQAWTKDQSNYQFAKKQQAVTSTNQLTQNKSIPTAVNSMAKSSTTSVVPQNTATLLSQNKKTISPKVVSNYPTIQVTTPKLSVVISTHGGNLVQAKLPQYAVSLKDKSPVTLLNNTNQNWYVAQSGLTGHQGPDTNQGQVVYRAKQLHYQLKDNDKQLIVPLTWKNKQGLMVTKEYIFKPDSYTIGVKYIVNNQGRHLWKGRFYAQLQQQPKESGHGLLAMHNYVGAAYSAPDKPYTKLEFKSMKASNLDSLIKGGWVAMQQRYFLSSWVANQQQNNHYYSHVNDGRYTLGFLAPQLIVKPHQKAETSAQLYVGPEIAKNLHQLAHGLDLTIDYGWLWFISDIIFKVMNWLHHLLGNWGWSIVLVTLLIKAIFYKLSEKSYASMARMRELQPRLEALKARFGDDRQKMGQATMQLYKEEKVNPVGGCLPMLVQIPVFIALYWVLLESVQLRQAPFMFWIHDLSAKDPFYVLPLLMGFTMFLQQKLTPSPPDPTQAKMMMLMPVIFTVFFLNFPAGLVLYWLTNNILSVTQQWYIMRQFELKKSKNSKQKKTDK